MKNLLRISCIAIFTTAIGIGCMPMMMMDSGSEHSKTVLAFENVTSVGRLRVKVMISPLEKRKESTISVELTNAENGKPFGTALVQCFIELIAQQSHEGHANTEQMSGEDSLQVERYEKTSFEKNILDSTDPTSPPLRGEGRRGLQRWLTMETTGPGTFGLTYVPKKPGAYRIQVKISDVEGANVAEPVIVENIRQTADHADTSMGHGMMGGLGDYGIVAVVGMVTIMAVAMVFRWL